VSRPIKLRTSLTADEFKPVVSVKSMLARFLSRSAVQEVHILQF